MARKKKKGRRRLHKWPVRRNPETGRHEVQIDGAWVSRQRAWQLRMAARGRCVGCAFRNDRPGLTLCSVCWEQKKVRFATAA